MRFLKKANIMLATTIGAGISLIGSVANADESHADDTFVEGVFCASSGNECATDNFANVEVTLMDSSPVLELNESDVPQEWRLNGDTSVYGGVVLQDITSTTVPFKVENGAPNNTLVMNGFGLIGLGTNTPFVPLHIAHGSPTVRLEDLGVGIAWDVSNSDGDFVLQEEATVPFRVFQGAPLDSLVVAGSESGTTPGDVGLGTNTPAEALHVRRSDGSAKVLVEEASSTIATRDLMALKNNGIVLFGMENTDTGDIWDFSNRTSGFSITLRGSGGSEMLVQPDGTFRVGPGNEWRFVVQPGGDATLDGTLTEGSSREIKENIQGVSEREVLAKLDQLPLSEWQYKEGNGSRHMGPMAEDFHATYGLGPDAKHIAPKDLAGVAMASAKALKDELERKEKRIEELEAKANQVDELQAEQQAMRAELDRLKQLVEEGR